jgi:hypothetical protein
MNFLSNVLREDGGFEYKKAIVDSILILIKDIPDAKEPGLGHLCEFIEVRTPHPAPVRHSCEGEILSSATNFGKGVCSAVPVAWEPAASRSTNITLPPCCCMLLRPFLRHAHLH